MKNKFKSYKNKISLFLSTLLLFQLIMFNVNTIFTSANTTGKSISSSNAISLTLNANKTNISLGETITFTANSNLESNAQYCFFIYNDGSWNLVQNYSSKNTLSYTPSKTGTYKVRAIVRDKYNTSNYEFKYLNFTVNDKASLTSLKASKTTTSLGESITFEANSNLGANAQYCFYVYIDGSWNLVQNYSSKNTLLYTAPKVGNFKVRAIVRDKYNTSNYDYEYLSFTVNNKASLTSLSSNKINTALGEPIVFSANSNIGANAQYCFYVYTDSSWKLAQGYSSKNTFVYTPDKAGTYRIRAIARDRYNTSNYDFKYVTFTVNNKIVYPNQIPILKQADGINKKGVGDSAYEILKDLGWSTIDENTISINHDRLQLKNMNGVDGIDSIVTIKCDFIENDKDVLFLLSLMLDENSTISYDYLIQRIANGTGNIEDGNRNIYVQYDGKIDYTITVTFYNYK